MKPLSCSFGPEDIHSMSPLADYVESLESLALIGSTDPTKSFATALGEQTSNELRRRVTLEIRRQFGAFFTSGAMANRLVNSINDSVDYYWDPSLGGGDLLLAAASRLSVAATLEQTLLLWSEHLGGTDLHKLFVRAAKARLVLLARVMGRFTAPLQLKTYDSMFKDIAVGDGLKKTALPPRTAVLMNPPYLPTTVKNNWARGKVNMAAVFVDHYVNIASAGTQILAILPEVIRSGSNYDKLRISISSKASKVQVASWGLFDRFADVDVFNLNLHIGTTGNKSEDWPKHQSLNGTTLHSVFDVSVGAVVPHRHHEKGVLRRFVDARSVPSCGTVRRVRKRRKFSGTVVKPPFVTIKRTSRPGDKHRAVPTLILGKDAVAVENHLIVCKPKDGSVETCHQLVERLQTTTVSEWLNVAIRCRHLTVNAVRNITLTDSPSNQEKQSG